ncbi:hypothetical protein DFS33DRAFT_613 [Desarmillaria ectypa]|nr:hypothetical protein DFS33DRAFT_613 [Desarmillaria ectypa]
MPSERVTLPSFAELCQSLNRPHPPQPRGTLVQPNAGPTSPPPVINVNSYGHKVIQGPVSHDQCWLEQIQGIAYKNCPPGYDYAMRKPLETWPPAHERQWCHLFTCDESGEYCSLLQQGTIAPQTYIDPLKTLGNSYRIYLHRPKGDKRNTLPVLKTIPFISADPSDRALGLPGVSISRLIAKEPDILVNANSFGLNPRMISSMNKLNIEVRVVGCKIVDHIEIRVECNHAVKTHLGIAYMLVHSFHQVILRSTHRKPFDEMGLRLVALYTVDPSSEYWNAAYAIVDN